MAVAYAGAAALAVSGPVLARRVRRMLPAPIADLAVTGGLTLTGWSMLAVLERVAPHRAEWNEPDDEAATDRAYLGVLLVPTAVGSNALAGVLASGIQRSLGVGARGDDAADAPRLPIAVGVVRALLVTELIHYWQHRTAHRVGVLWRAHEVHHSEKRMYWVNGTRFHPLDEVPLVTLQGVALRLAQVDPDALLVHNVFKLIHGLLQHANIDGSCRALQPVVSTPAQHRLHHAAVAGDDGVNFGAVLSIWDRAFGTAQTPSDPPSRTTQIGLLDVPDFPPGFVDQLVYPFRGARPDR